MIAKAQFAPDSELAIFRTDWRPKRLWAFSAPYPFQDLGIVATGIDANGEYESLLSMVRSRGVEDFCHRPMLMAPSGIA
jgi:hypothetical protein